ncbi:MAG: hypothetical protein J6N18_10415, partial [Kiritimatiellae bacterium]|nr:hypothetical protein [Kiritimatiellia bacterium]
VELTYAGQLVSVTSASTSFTNERQKITVDLIKSLEQDAHYGIGMNGEIQSVKFALYAAKVLTAEDGSEIPADGLLEIASCDSNGKITFTTDIPLDAELYVKEYSTDSHYILSDVRYPVAFLYAGQSVPSVSVTVNDGNTISNEIIRGSILGKKLDEDGFSICGCVFGLFRADETEFTEANALLTCPSNELGVFLFENVPFGNWIVREISSTPAFILNTQNYPVSIERDGQTVQLEIVNKFITGGVKVTKVDAEYPENKLTGATFEVYVDVDGDKVFDPAIDILIGELTETETGIYTMDGLRYNGYFIHEKVAPEGFLLDDGYYYFEIRTHEQIVTVETEAGKNFINNPIKGNAETTKVDAEYPENKLSGAVFEIYEDTNGNGKFDADTDKLLGQMKESEIGIYTMNDLRYGGYFLHEKVAPEGFLLDNGYHYFEIRNHGETVIVENEAGKSFINDPIKGSVETDKVDADYPDNTLSGAIFEIYEDSNGNGKFDAGTDKLIGEMTEGENGKHSMNDLRYGGYFLHEKVAPKGFLLDDGYYFFEIREHGKTVTVSNNAGTCFINKAMTGSFELVKKDKADGTPLKDVGFRILDENGRFGTTLRLGKYFYQETDPLDGYVADDTQYAFEIREHGQIVSVEVTNEKISVIPDTGDHNILSVAGSTMLVSALALMILLGFRKKETCAEI